MPWKVRIQADNFDRTFMEGAVHLTKNGATIRSRHCLPAATRVRLRFDVPGESQMTAFGRVTEEQIQGFSLEFIAADPTFGDSLGRLLRGESIAPNRPPPFALPTDSDDIDDVHPTIIPIAEAGALKEQHAAYLSTVETDLSAERFTEARQGARTLISLYPSDPQVLVLYHLATAGLFMSQGNAQGAAEHWRKVVELDPGCEAATNALREIQQQA